MNIRLMQIADYPQVFALWNNTPGMGLQKGDDSRPQIAKFLEKNPTTCFVAEDQGVIAGTVLGGNDGRRGYMYHMAVAPEYRRQGIAKQMVDRVLDGLRELGIGKCALVAYIENDLGNRFWESIGFHQRHDIYYRDLFL